MLRNVFRKTAGRLQHNPTFKMALCHREIKINYANVQQFACTLEPHNVCHVGMEGATLARLSALYIVNSSKLDKDCQ